MGCDISADSHSGAGEQGRDVSVAGSSAANEHSPRAITQGARRPAGGVRRQYNNASVDRGRAGEIARPIRQGERAGVCFRQAVAARHLTGDVHGTGLIDYQQTGQCCRRADICRTAPLERDLLGRSQSAADIERSGVVQDYGSSIVLIKPLTVFVPLSFRSPPPLPGPAPLGVIVSPAGRVMLFCTRS